MELRIWAASHGVLLDRIPKEQHDTSEPQLFLALVWNRNRSVISYKIIDFKAWDGNGMIQWATSNESCSWQNV